MTQSILSKKRQEGFTIIEVLIVLAIAGLIILIVFLAVPALQRNSRNTQAKNGAAAVLSAVNEYVTNNNGKQPSSLSITNDGQIQVGDGTTTQVTGKTQGGYVASISTTAPTETGTFVLAKDSKCNGNAVEAGHNRAFAVLYNVENSSGVTPQCTEG
jgi:type IV pilus assembly protein PilA